MTRHRWMKFWPQDWRNDSALRMCRRSARSLWIDLICLMHDADPYGHLTVSGRAPNSSQLAMILGMPEAELIEDLAVLEDAGVFSRTRDGVIFSRRMVRDAQYSAKQAKFGKKGGNPNIKETKASRHTLKGSLDGGDKVLEAEYQKQNSNPSSLEEREEGSSPGKPDAPQGSLINTPVAAKAPRKPAEIPEAQLLELVAVWNQMAAASGLAQVSDMTAKRRTHLRARIASRWQQDPLRQFTAYCRRISQSAFLRGENPRNWKADFNWAIKSDDTVLQVAEGKYDDGGNET